MSGLEALGTAAAIAQLAQYGIQFARKAVEVHKSTEGTSEQLKELQRMSQNLHSFAGDFAKRGQGSASGNSQADVDLQRIAEFCQVEAISLLDLADRLKEHERRLVELQRELHGRILKIIQVGQGGLEAALIKISKQNTTTQDRLLREFEACKGDLLAVINGLEHKEDDVIQLLTRVKKEWEQALRRQNFLASLTFPGMQTRYEGITEANDSTYKWVFPTDPAIDKEVNFASWLQQDGGIFWVTGKAGSGKSTLMKYVVTQQRTTDLLGEWAGLRSLVIASFYFWNAGGSMQKSQEGLLRSILYSVFRRCPELIDHVLTAQSDNILHSSSGSVVSWTTSALRKCLRIAIDRSRQSGPSDVCFCFFIDGLDEYPGDHEELIRLIFTMEQWTGVKLCVASRPWQVFQDAFRSSQASNHWFQLHLHTRDDIAAVAHQGLDHLVQSREDDRDEVRLLILELIEKAEGVFLWVTLVIKELIKGFRHADNLRSLRKRLEKIPPGLDEYFKHILDDVDQFYIEESARIFLCCLTADLQWLPLQAFSYIARGDPIDAPATIAGWSEKNVIERMRKQLNGRCLDLLQILPNTTHERPFHIVQFLHRTVKDFLQNADVTAFLRRQAGPDFDVEKVMCGVYIACVDPGWIKLHDVQVRWAGYVLTYAQSLELRDGVTMCEPLRVVCDALQRSPWFPATEWVLGIVGTFSDQFLIGSDDLITPLTMFIRLGLVQNAREYLSHHGSEDYSQLSMFRCMVMAFEVVHRLSFRHGPDGKTYRDVVIRYDSDQHPQSSIAGIPAESLLQHITDPKLFQLLLAKMRMQQGGETRNSLAPVLWKKYWKMILCNFTSPWNQLQLPDSVRQNMQDITMMFSQDALVLTNQSDGGSRGCPTNAELVSALRILFGDDKWSESLGLSLDVTPPERMNE